MKIIPTVLASLFLATQVGEAHASNTTSVISSKIAPKYDRHSIQEAFRKAAQLGSTEKINKVIKLVDKHDLILNARDVSWVTADVAQSGNLEAINLRSGIYR